MKKSTIDNIIAIVEPMPTDGRSIEYKMVCDVMTQSEWNICYEWMAENAKQYVSIGSNRITALNRQRKETLLAKLRLPQSEIKQADANKELNNKVLADTLRNNSITRRISALSLIVAIAALIVSIVVPCCFHSESSSGEQQVLRNDSMLRISVEELSDAENVEIEPSRAKSLTLISDNSRNTLLICATLTSFKSIVAVLSSTAPSLKL